ncbi:MAG: hypothetical protein ACP5M4_02935 [Acidobacteriaceae bacterium]
MRFPTLAGKRVDNSEGAAGKPPLFASSEGVRVSMMKAVLKIAGLMVLAGLVCPGALAQQAQEAFPEPAPLQMRQVGRAQMPQADRALLDSAEGRLARAARLFGYRMQEPGWTCDEVMTPDTPDYLMMVCRRMEQENQRSFAFSALIARRGDAVYVVPVLFGGAAPWKTAANMKASREIFNHVVPERIAAKAVKPSGNWITLGLTFTALAGDDSVVLAAPSSHVRWIRAPEPTILMRNGSSARTIVFSDVSPRDGIRTWTLSFNAKGMLTAADVKVEPFTKPLVVSTKIPRSRMLNSLPSPMRDTKPVPGSGH